MNPRQVAARFAALQATRSARPDPLAVDEWLKRQYVRGEITLEQFEKRIEKFIRVEGATA